MKDIYKTISSAIVSAMKSKDTVELAALRDIKSEMSKTLNGRSELPDDEALSVLTRLKKQRLKAIEEFSSKLEFVVDNQNHLSVINQYLPSEIPTKELSALIELTKDILSESNQANIGSIMKAVKQSITERGYIVDGTLLSNMVKEML